jgi:hypothetical protein
MTLVKKVVVDQLTYGPLCNLAAMAYIGLVVEGQLLRDWLRSLRTSFPAACVGGWKVWPLATLVQFHVPINLRPLFMNAVGMLWCAHRRNTLRIVMLGSARGRQKMALERWTNAELSRRACSPLHALQSCRGESAGGAKRPLSRSPIRNSPIRNFFFIVFCILQSVLRALKRRSDGTHRLGVLTTRLCWPPQDHLAGDHSRQGPAHAPNASPQEARNRRPRQRALAHLSKPGALI